MRPRTLLHSALLLLVSGVPAQSFKPSKHIHEEVDPYTHYRTMFLGDIHTSTCPDDPSPPPHEAKVQILLAAFERPGRHVDYFFTTDLTYGSSLNLRSGDRLDVLADGRVGWLTTTAGSTIVTAYESSRGPTYLHETIPFEVTRENLQSLAGTQFLQFRINASKQSIQRCVNAKQLHDVAEFLDATAEY